MINVAILGSGGLGKNMALLIEQKKEFKLVGICDRSAYFFNESGIDGLTVKEASSVEKITGARSSTTPINDLIKNHKGKINAIFIALPNLPNEFIPSIAKEISALGYKGVIVDALKRTKAVQMIKDLDSLFKECGILYLTGCGATPGLLTTAAALGAQSFVEILDVTITFGVGISNWETYKATIREDIAHLDGFNPAIVLKMTDEEIIQELNKRNGILELHHMEHADDIMLEMANICPRDRVTTGGVVDTRNTKKPLSTNVKITGRTFEGKISTHQFVLGDETTMAANVNGPILGFMKSGIWLYGLGVRGTVTSAEIMPHFGPAKENYLEIQKKQKATLVNAAF
ncbi:MAG: saccharopine dehydrogenase-like oxidoreductase [Candidatus Melainabacteria bacterium RIFCSPHIGHO2_02_FULL_34_12]|nr:MAG: saccharopine dehydrogenase-like oxidoreductase [Candidatus Melainabacteria bacterium RIFCSPHIGHO2_02_FULL_34_12]